MAPIHFGCLVFDYQAIDVLGPTDLLNSAVKSHLQQIISPFTPISKDTIAHAPEIIFHHIGATQEPVRLATSSFVIVSTTTVDDWPELDCLLIGGPDLSTFALHPKLAGLIRDHVGEGRTLFTNCIGSAVAASTGVLDGKRATIKNIVYELAKKAYPAVERRIDNKWVVDGNIWTAGGAASGMDMFAYWLKENLGTDVLTCAASLLDFDPRI
jgi:transcriptional regulator GlxA family with amidase domain